MEETIQIGSSKGWAIFFENSFFIESDLKIIQFKTKSKIFKKYSFIHRLQNIQLNYYNKIIIIIIIIIIIEL